MKKSMWFSDLRLRLVFLVLLAVIPALAVIFRAADQQRSALALEGQQTALRTARLVSANQEVLIAGTRQLLTALANAPVVQNGDPGCSAFLHELLEKYPYYSNLGVANSDGWQTCSALSLPTGPTNIADRAYFRRTIARGDFALGDYQIGRVTGKATINAGYPLYDRGGKLVGIVYAGIDLAWLQGMAAKTRLPAGSTVTLVDRNGTIFVRYPEMENAVGRVMPAGALRDAIQTQNGEGIVDAKGMDGVERLYGFLPLLDGAATVIVGLPKEGVSAIADRIAAQSLWWIALASLLAIVSAWWGGNWLIVRQVRSLTQAAEQLAHGDLAARVGLPQVGGEMQQLAAAFNRMAEALEQREAEARRADDELRLHLEKTTALREINVALTSTLDLPAVLNMLLEKIGQLWPGTAALVWLKNSDTGAWERTACWNFDEAEWKGRDPHALPPVVKAVIESRSPLIVADVTRDARILDHEFYRRQGLVSYLGVPLVVKGEALGILAFLTHKEHRFTAEEVDFFSTLAGQAAMAIHNSQLHAETKEQTLKLETANRDLKRKEAIQALLKELNQDIAADDLDTLLKKLTDKVREFFKVDIADVRLIGEASQILGISGVDEAEMRGGASGKGGGSRWVMEHRRPLVLPDISRAKDPPIGQTARRLGIQGYLSVPLFSRSGEVVGVLRALSYQPREFLAEEIDLLQQMSNGAAVALENARLLEQTRQQADALSQANKVKNEFLGFVSHELRTPINIIMGYSALMEGGFCGEANPEQAKVIEKIVVNSRALLSMIDQLLEATKIEAGAVKPDFQQVSLSDFVDELRSVYTVPNHKNIELVWDYPADLPVVTTDPDKLRHVLTNLLGNAVKYTESGTVSVSAVNRPAEGTVEFQVADTGIGIPREELPHIFDMFSQVHGARARARSGGVGLGLHIVKKFTELLGGDISVASVQGSGSTFTLKIPSRSGDAIGKSDAPLRNTAGTGSQL
jgi:signal transduction histidine kinase/HAMP domain-containing protein